MAKGGTQEGVLLKTVGGDVGEETRWRATLGRGRPDGARVRMASDPGESYVGDTEGRMQAPQEHPSQRGKITLWVGVPPNGRVIWGAPQSFGSQANLCSPIVTTLLFGVCPMFLIARSPGTR